MLGHFSMQNCAPRDTPMVKHDKFCLLQYSKMDLEKKEMETIPYALAIGSLMYAQICMCPALHT